LPSRKLESSAKAIAFAPGRVNLIGEHSADSGGLALAFAVQMGVTVTAVCGTAVTGGASPLVQATVAELRVAGVELPSELSVSVISDLPAGMGLSSSAAVRVATVLALLDLAGAGAWPAMEIAVLCQRVEHQLGAEAGLLDLLAILLGRFQEATLFNVGALSWSQVPVKLGGAKLALLDSGERRELVTSDDNTRHEETRRGDRRRMRHVNSENQRVRLFVESMGDPVALGALLDESHMSLRDDFEVSTQSIEDTVRRALDAGAFGARIMGGGFGRSVLGLFPGDARLPGDAVEVEPAEGAHLL
jgi:galactokinase